MARRSLLQASSLKQRPDDARYSVVGGLNGGLGNQFVVGHRGATLMYPENTMDGYRACVAGGVPSIAVPVHMTLDGVFVVNHDSTFDRVTNYTGGPAIESLASAKALQLFVQPSKTNVAGYGYADNTYRPVFLSQVLAELGGRVNLWIELKSTGTKYANALIALLNRYPSLKGTIVVQDFSYADLKLIAAAGYECQWLDSAGTLASGPTPATAAQMLTDGIRWHGPDYTLIADGTVSSLVAAGLKVVPWVVNRRYDRDHLYALGCIGIISDDPLYTNGSSPLAKTTSFASAALFPGQRSGNENPASGHGRGFYNGGKMQIDATGPTFVCIGMIGPIPSVGQATGQVTMQCTVDAVGSDPTRNIVVALTKDDRPETSGGNTASTPDGYYGLIKPGTATATVNLYRDVAAVRTGLGGATPSALAAGQTFTITISWTATSITFTFNGGSITDSSAQRLTGPMYVHLGKDGGAAGSDSGLLVSYGDPVVTP